MKPARRKSGGTAGRRTKEGEGDNIGRRTKEGEGDNIGRRTKEGEGDNICFDLSSMKLAINDVATKPSGGYTLKIEKLMKRNGKPLYSAETIRRIKATQSFYEEYENFVIGLRAQGMTIPYY